MDEDNNLSNADISIEDVEQVRETMMLQDDEEDDETSDVDLSSVAYVLPANVSISPGTGTAAAGAGSSPRTSGGASAAGPGNSHSPFHDWDSSVDPPPPVPNRVGGGGGSGAASTGGSGGNNSGASTGDSGAKPSFFFGTSSFSLRSRKEVAALINTECCRGSPTPDLDSIMDTLFNPGTPIDNPDNIEWIRWLIAGGRTPQEFVKIGKFLPPADHKSVAPERGCMFVFVCVPALPVLCAAPYKGARARQVRE